MINLIKTEELLQELVNRCSEQLTEADPKYDGILSFFTPEELDQLMSELLSSLRAKRVAVRVSGK